MLLFVIVLFLNPYRQQTIDYDKCINLYKIPYYNVKIGMIEIPHVFDLGKEAHVKYLLRFLATDLDFMSVYRTADISR